MLRGDKEAICSLITPLGFSGAALIRISGFNTFNLVKEIANFLPSKIVSHKIYFGTLVSKNDSLPIDEVLVFCFEQGKSFTGDETIEISCHGNPQIIQNILDELISLGCRAADRGEFTFRAFMNGKIDLSQAEGVLSLIESKSKAAKNQSLRQLKGGLSKVVTEIEDKLVWCGAQIEAGIDFSAEDIEVINANEIKLEIRNLIGKLDILLSTYSKGRIINSGLVVSIIGKPNVGKSSLLNNLLQEDKAIVSEVEGTTRDPIEGIISVLGINVKFVDTAGIRHTTDSIEQFGIKKALKSISDCDLLVYVYDSTDVNCLSSSIEKDLSTYCKPTILVGNKIDLVSDKNFKKKSIDSDFLVSHLLLSANDLAAGKVLTGEIGTFLKFDGFSDDTVIFQTRHFESLGLAREALIKSEQLLGDSLSYEFVSLSIKEAIIHIQEILGKRFDDDILDRVFKEFCLGK